MQVDLLSIETTDIIAGGIELDTPVLLELQNASFGYPTHRGWVVLLHNLYLTLYKGQWLVVLGPNGGGKSTLARGLLRLSPILEGSLTVSSTSSMILRYIPQRLGAGILGETVADELATARNCSYTGKQIADLLEELGLSVPLHSPVKKLSGGQKQLLSFASALLDNPDLLIVDEGAAMLNPAIRHRLLNFLEKKVRQTNLSILWMTQQLEDIFYADEIAIVQNGTLLTGWHARSFFYSEESPWQPSTCRKLGYIPPFSIQVGEELYRRGIPWSELPLQEIQSLESAGVHS
ncbi:ABC transporter ATP-binding protein [Alicyclobacillus tolerans]|uniref:ABC transporter ATP-binding protein n=1 Tax=Alicyclobacillus tolerans TaxID=90970 RepID=UPI003B7DFC22